MNETPAHPPLLHIELLEPFLNRNDPPLRGHLRITAGEALHIESLDLWLEQEFPGRETVCIGSAALVLAQDWEAAAPQEVAFALAMTATPGGIFDLSGMTGAFRARSAAIGEALETAASDHYLRVQVQGVTDEEDFVQEGNLRVKVV